MRKILFSALSILILSVIFISCTKAEEDFDAVGGELPSNYIIIQADGSFSPALITVASGSSITFVNNDIKPHNILSNDSTSIVTSVIPSKGFFKFKNDTLIGVFPYKCILDSTIKGTIVITP
jgi:plastocyanin